MNIKKCFLVLMLSFLTVSSAYAAEKTWSDSQSPSQERFEKRGKRVHEIYDQLNLTDDQKKQITENKSKHREDMKALREQRESFMQAMRQELMKPDLDMNKINQIHEQSKAVQAKIADDRLNSILEVRKILTPEQFTKFIGLMQDEKSDGHRGGRNKKD